MNINIYRISAYSDDDFFNMEKTISASRSERFSNYALGKKRQSVLATYMLEKLLAEKYGYTIDKIEYYYSKNGKPYVVGDKFFSISHSGDFVAVAIDDKPVGIDIEKLQRKLPKHIEHSRFFSDSEKELFKFDGTAFLLLWTFKEAVSKTIDIHLTQVLTQIEYPLCKMLCNYSWEEVSDSRNGIIAKPGICLNLQDFDFEGKTQYLDNVIPFKQYVGEDYVLTVAGVYECEKYTS